MDCFGLFFDALLTWLTVTVKLNFIRIVRERDGQTERFCPNFSDKRETEMARKSGSTSDK
jgi:hypothetical protein